MSVCWKHHDAGLLHRRRSSFPIRESMNAAFYENPAGWIDKVNTSEIYSKKADNSCFGHDFTDDCLHPDSYKRIHEKPNVMTQDKANGL